MSLRPTFFLAGLVAALCGGALPASAQTSSAPAAAAPAAAIEFQTEADAHAHCPGAKLVWANLTSKAYHLSGDRFYGSGKTKKGAFMCQADADANGFHKAGTRHAAAAAHKPS
jgi:hypothetical protein